MKQSIMEVMHDYLDNKIDKTEVIVDFSSRITNAVWATLIFNRAILSDAIDIFCEECKENEENFEDRVMEILIKNRDKIAFDLKEFLTLSMDKDDNLLRKD